MSAPKTRSDEKPVVAIERITIAVGGKKFELTLQEARALQDALNKTFEPKTVFQSLPAPIIIEREVERNPWPYRPVPIWWGQGPTCVEQPKRIPEVECRNGGWNAGERLDSMLQARTVTMR